MQCCIFSKCIYNANNTHNTITIHKFIAELNKWLNTCKINTCHITPISQVDIPFWFICCMIPLIFSAFLCYVFIVYIDLSRASFAVLGVHLWRFNKIYLLTYLNVTWLMTILTIHINRCYAPDYIVRSISPLHSQCCMCITLFMSSPSMLLLWITQCS